jgi:hypothetical protein
MGRKAKNLEISNSVKNSKVTELLTPNDQGKYLVWSLHFSHLFKEKINDNNIYAFELLGEKMFDKHRVYQMNNAGEDGKYNYEVLLGQLKVRKRELTMLNYTQKMMDSVCVENASIGPIYGSLSYKIISSNRKFNSCIKEYVPVSNSSNADYYGKDIQFLNDKDKRKSWQNYLLDLIYNEENNIFTRSDDRTIVWIEDQSGNTGKSKWIKWLCANREEDVIKLTFGSTQQLKSALINGGARKVYFVDIPRTTSKEDSLPALISVVEDLKNGHLSSVMYGNYRSLFLEPPHVLVFSNKECPLKLMSDDRWCWIRINKDGDSFTKIRC